MIKAAEWLNEKYDSQIVEVEINDQYYNMREKNRTSYARH